MRRRLPISNNDFVVGLLRDGMSFQPLVDQAWIDFDLGPLGLDPYFLPTISHASQ